MGIRRIFKEPHPIGFGWAYSLIPALAVFFILTVLGPYGFAELTYVNRFLRAIPFTIITGLAAPINLLIAKSIFPNVINEAKWTIGSEFIYNMYDIALIGFWNSLFLLYIGKSEVTYLQTFLNILAHTLVIGVIPVIALIAFKHNQALRRQLLKVNDLNEELKSHANTEKVQNLVSFFTENEKFEIKLNPTSILFLKSEGNYVELHYINESGKQSKYVLRNRLKTVLESLPKNTFFHCHKSYIVNLDKITLVEGNARNLNLKLSETIHKIPVSRNKSAELLTTLKRR